MQTVINTTTSLITRGGWVMYPLLLLSIISIALSLERIWFWFRLHQSMPNRQTTALAAALRTGNIKLVEQLLRRDKSLIAYLIRQMLVDSRAAQSVAVEIIEEMRSRTERFMTTLSTIITAAPLIGILGTVIGIIQSFQLLGQSRMATDPTQVSAGIAQALLTTAAGLIIALITLFPYMSFKTYIDRTLGQFEIILSAFEVGFSNDNDKSNNNTSNTQSPQQSPKTKTPPQTRKQ